MSDERNARLSAREMSGRPETRRGGLLSTACVAVLESRGNGQSNRPCRDKPRQDRALQLGMSNLSQYSRESLLPPKVAAMADYGMAISLVGICIKLIWHADTVGIIIGLAGGILWALATLTGAAVAITAELRQLYGSVTGTTLALSALLFLSGFPYLLVLLATGRVPASVYSNASGFWGWLLNPFEFFLLAAIPGILIVCPEFQRKWGLKFQCASALSRSVLPTVLAVAAAFATTAYLFLQHFGGGPLAKLSLGPLTAGLLAVITLLTPLYRLIACASWEHGIAALLAPRSWWDNVKSVRHEIDAAVKPVTTVTSVTTGPFLLPVEHG